MSKSVKKPIGDTREAAPANTIRRPIKLATGWGLYATPENTGTRGFYLPRVDVLVTNPAYNRAQLCNYSRQLFAQLGNLAGAIQTKAQYAVGNSWTPQYRGGNREWGDTAESWLAEQFYPLADVRGEPYDFVTDLFLDSIAMDVDGDAAILLTENESGFPRVQYIPAHRIGTRNAAPDGTVRDGPYRGARIVDGVILNDSGRAIGYQILGRTPDEDRYESAFNVQLLYEPEWQFQYRGVPRIAHALLDLFDLQDIDVFPKRGTKLASSIGLLHWNETGAADETQDFIDTTGALPQPINGVVSEQRVGGEILYLKAGANEKLEAFKTDSPSLQTEAFIARLERRSLMAVGWFYELMDPSKIGGASVRLIQDMARQSVAARQRTLRKRALRVVRYAVAKAMKNGLLPRNDEDWWAWDFELPALISVDNGYEEEADRKNLILGTTTRAAVCAKRAKWWDEVLDQRRREAEAIITAARELSQTQQIPLETALSFLWSPSQIKLMDLDIRDQDK